MEFRMKRRSKIDGHTSCAGRCSVFEGDPYNWTSVEGDRVSRRSGITLIELVITLAILAVLVALVVPSLGKWIQHYRMRGTVREIVSQMELAKIKALKTNREYRVAFDKTSGTFQIETCPNPSGTWRAEGNVFKIPHQIPVDMNVGAIRFNPDGTAVSGTVTVGAKDGEHYNITVNTTTGKITATREK